MKKVKLLCMILIIILMMLLLSGCWSNKEVDETAYVLVMGFDRGEDDNLLITFQIANPRELASSESGGENNKSYVFNTLEAPLPIAGYTLLNTIHTRKVSLSHTRAYIFSEELAKEGFQDVLYPLIMFRETRGSAYTFVCKGKAMDLMKKSVESMGGSLESSPSKQFELFEKITKQLGFSYMINLNNFYKGSKNLYMANFLPLLGERKKDVEMESKDENDYFGNYLPGEMPEKGENVQFIGMSVFKDNKMIDMLTGDETRYLLFLWGMMDESVLVIDDPIKPEHKIGLYLKQHSKPDFEIDLDPEKPKIEIKLSIDVFLVGIPNGVDYASSTNKEKLEDTIIKVFNERCHDLIDKAQKEYKKDIFFLAERVKMKFWDNGSWEDFDWDKKFIKADIGLEFDIKIKQAGKQIRTE